MAEACPWLREAVRVFARPVLCCALGASWQPAPVVSSSRCACAGRRQPSARPGPSARSCSRYGSCWASLPILPSFLPSHMSCADQRPNSLARPQLVCPARPPARRRHAQAARGRTAARAVAAPPDPAGPWYEDHIGASASSGGLALLEREFAPPLPTLAAMPRAADDPNHGYTWCAGRLAAPAQAPAAFPPAAASSGAAEGRADAGTWPPPHTCMRPRPVRGAAVPCPRRRLNHPCPSNPFRSKVDEDMWYVEPTLEQRRMALAMGLPLEGIW